jgi:amino acid transporter
LFIALIFSAILFLLIQIVAIGTLPGLADSKTPLADAANGFMGNFGAAFIAIGALISILGNLNGGFLATSRIPFAMAEQREILPIMGATHERFKTPYISIIFTSLVILIFTIQSSFLSALTIATITRLLVYATTCGALPVFRYRQDAPKAQFNAPFGIIIAIVSLLLIIWLLTNVDFQKEGLPILILMAVGLGIYLVSKFLQSKS